MKFWDSSALVPLLVPEAQSASCSEELAVDRQVIVWAMTPLEAGSALHRLRRDRRLSEEAMAEAERRLARLRDAWTEVRDVDLVSRRAARLLAVHALRASDAFQLGAALVACGDRPHELPFMCLDTLLRAAARREGFSVLPA